MKNQLDDEKLKCLNNKAFILNSLKRHEESIKVDEMILKEYKNNHASLARSMHNYIKMGEIEKAKSISEQLKSFFPEQAEGDYNELFCLLKEIIFPVENIKSDDVENQMQNKEINKQQQSGLTKMQRFKRVMYLSFFLVVMPVTVFVFAYYKNIKFVYTIFSSVRNFLFLKEK